MDYSDNPQLFLCKPRSFALRSQSEDSYTYAHECVFISSSVSQVLTECVGCYVTQCKSWAQDQKLPPVVLTHGGQLDIQSTEPLPAVHWQGHSDWQGLSVTLLPSSLLSLDLYSEDTLQKNRLYIYITLFLVSFYSSSESSMYALPRVEMHGMHRPFCGFLRCRSATLGDNSSILRVSSPPSLAGDPGDRRSHLLLQRSGHQRVPPPGRKLLEASTVAQSCRVLLLHCCHCPGTYLA